MIRIGNQRDSLGESPLWDAADQVLYWIDIRRPALRRFDPATNEVETRAMPALIGSIALATPGSLLVALAGHVARYDWAADRHTTVATLPAGIPGHRFNDGRCDRQGRFWVGTMHNETRAPEGVLYRLDTPGNLRPIRDGICIPNSLAWSPDGRQMYFSDSLQVLQPDISKWGGISANIPIAWATVAAGKSFCPHVFGGGIALLASLHLLAAVGGDGLLEFDCHPNAGRERVIGSALPVRNGHVPLPPQPGLGCVADLAALDKYRTWPPSLP